MSPRCTAASVLPAITSRCRWTTITEAAEGFIAPSDLHTIRSERRSLLESHAPLVVLHFYSGIKADLTAAHLPTSVRSSARDEVAIARQIRAASRFAARTADRPPGRQSAAAEGRCARAQTKLARVRCTTEGKPFPLDLE